MVAPPSPKLQAQCVVSALDSLWKLTESGAGPLRGSAENAATVWAALAELIAPNSATARNLVTI